MKRSKSVYFVETSCGLYAHVSRREFEYVRRECNMYGHRPDITIRSFDGDSCLYHFISFELE